MSEQSEVHRRISKLFLVGGEGNLRSFRQHSVYELVVLEGSGVPEDPYRNVAYWVTSSGHLLVRLDPAAQVEAGEG